MARQFVGGRLKSFDARSRNFPVRRLTVGLEPKTVYWQCDNVLDQGSEPACVGFSWAHELIANPVPVPGITNAYGIKLYNGAKTMDEWPGEDYDGSSVLGGWKYCRSLGWYDSVAWGFSLQDWILGVQKGPAVIGITWKSDMMDIDANGFIHFSGVTEGSHAILMNGYNVEGHYFTFHNSWGNSWGNNGEAKISESDIDKARQDEAECAIITGRHDITTPVPPEPDEPGFCENIFGKIAHI